MASEGKAGIGSKLQRLWLWVVLVLILTAATAWLVTGARLRERLAAEATLRGLVLEGGTGQRGWFSFVRRDVTLSLRGAAGVRARIDRIELEKLPFSAPSLRLGHVRAELRGEPIALLAATAAVLRGDLLPSRLDIDYQHPRLPLVRFEEVKVEPRGTWFVLRARKVDTAGRGFDDVVLSVERREEMLLVAAGESPAASRLALSCFPPREGASRWLLSIHHQRLWPVAKAMGWTLGNDFDATQVAGAITIELPEAATDPIEGRVSLVFDRWPMAAPPEAEPFFGTTMSFLSNIVFTPELSSGRLPRLELKMPVFMLVGSGRVGPGPTLLLEAQGERSCRELAAFLPPSEARELVKRFAASQAGKPARDGSAARARLALRLGTEGLPGQGEGASWTFEPGCGLSAWSPPPR